MIPEFAVQAAQDSQYGKVPVFDAEGQIIGYSGSDPAPTPAPSPAPAPMGPPAPPSAGLDLATQAAIWGAYGPSMAPQLNPFPGKTAAPLAPAVSPQAELAVPPPDQGQANLAGLISGYARGNQQYVPGGVRKTAEQWDQAGFGPVPSADPKVAAANARAFQVAQAEREDIEGEALLNKRLQLQAAGDLQDETTRNEMIRARAYANVLQEAEADKAQRSQAIDSEIGKLEQLLEQRSKASAQNPVKQYFTDLGTWGRIVNGIAVGLGAMGQALAGGQNAALEIMNREIDGAIAAQRQQVDELGINISARRSILGMMLQKFRSPDAAEDAARYAMAGIAEQNWRVQASKEKSADLRNQMTTIADQVAMERAGLKEKALGAEHRTRWNDVPGRVVGNAGGLVGLNRLADHLGLKQGSKERQKFLIESARGGPKGGATALQGIGSQTSVPTDRNEVAVAEFMLRRRIDIPEILGGGQAYTVPGGEKETGDALRAGADIIKNLNRIQHLVRTETIASPTTQILIQQVGATQIGGLRTKLGLGVMSEGDKELVKPLSGEGAASFKNAALTDRLRVLENAKSLTIQSINEWKNQLYDDPMLTKKSNPQIDAVPVQ